MTTINRTTDLETLRDAVLRARANPSPLLAATAGLARRHRRARDNGWAVSDVVVTNKGNIRTIQESGESATVSRLSTEIFAAGTLVDDLAARHLPTSAVKVTGPDGGSGWAYQITTDAGDTFDLFLYHDSYTRTFRVRLLAPCLEKLGLIHETHLFSNGHLCISPTGAGQAYLADAYARSVLWCDGISAMLRGHAFPWGE